MDEMTQHNAALVEEINAAIEQAESQAIQLDQTVEIFTVEQGTARRAPARPAAEPRNPVKAMQARAKTAYLSQGNAAIDADWAEF